MFFSLLLNLSYSKYEISSPRNIVVNMKEKYTIQYIKYMLRKYNNNNNHNNNNNNKRNKLKNSKKQNKTRFSVLFSCKNQMRVKNLIIGKEFKSTW